VSTETREVFLERRDNKWMDLKCMEEWTDGCMEKVVERMDGWMYRRT